jgi:hypothetical protein
MSDTVIGIARIEAAMPLKIPGEIATMNHQIRGRAAPT